MTEPDKPINIIKYSLCPKILSSLTSKDEQQKHEYQWYDLRHRAPHVHEKMIRVGRMLWTFIYSRLCWKIHRFTTVQYRDPDLRHANLAVVEHTGSRDSRLDNKSHTDWSMGAKYSRRARNNGPAVLHRDHINRCRGIHRYHTSTMQGWEWIPNA